LVFNLLITSLHDLLIFRAISAKAFGVQEANVFLSPVSSALSGSTRHHRPFAMSTSSISSFQTGNDASVKLVENDAFDMIVGGLHVVCV
jgi:hypothetical protein